MKILIVEDNANMCQNISQAVTAPDVEIASCTSSSLVIPMYESEKPDVVLMDIRIKPLNGIATTKMLRALYPQAKVIMLTTHNEPERSGTCSKNISPISAVLSNSHNILHSRVNFHNQQNHRYECRYRR